MSCKHHWLIPDGKIVIGTCTICGEEKLFDNRPSRNRIDLIVTRQIVRKDRSMTNYVTRARSIDNEPVNPRKNLKEQRKEDASSK